MNVYLEASSFLIDTSKATMFFSIRYTLWFNFILGIKFIFFCFKLIIMSLSNITSPKTKQAKIKSSIKLNYNISIHYHTYLLYL